MPLPHRTRPAAALAKLVASLLVGLLALLGGLAWWSGEVPHWTLRGARMVVPKRLPALRSLPSGGAQAGRVLFVGDSNTAGTRVGGAANAYPAHFAAALDGTVRAVVRAFGGATVADHLARGLPEGAAQGSFAVAYVMLGTNDAATRGWLASRRPVALEAYRAGLTRLAQQLRRGGARVVILAPPPVGTQAMAARLQPYRRAAAQVAQATGSAFLDPASAFPDPDLQGLLQPDALHLGPEAQRLLGLWLASVYTTSASDAGNSSTGKPSPPSASHPS